ncbi:hypothetical protein SDC9_157054 [bioreactor metagenome]|uniref:Uncharacterized protein n=1 Tax=bioreactor metagenome TaxID=1076179 RepID=A0A645F896_9ZZZZ
MAVDIFQRHSIKLLKSIFSDILNRFIGNLVGAQAHEILENNGNADINPENDHIAHNA